MNKIIVNYPRTRRIVRGYADPERVKHDWIFSISPLNQAIMELTDEMASAPGNLGVLLMVNPSFSSDTTTAMTREFFNSTLMRQRGSAEQCIINETRDGFWGKILNAISEAGHDFAPAEARRGEEYLLPLSERKTLDEWGLDWAEVVIKVDGQVAMAYNRRVMVIPQTDGRFVSAIASLIPLRRFTKALFEKVSLPVEKKKEAKRPEYPYDFTIGSDPEFAAYACGESGPDFEQLYPANNFTSNTSDSPVGTDGHCCIFEWRPAPAKTAKEAVENISKCVDITGFRLAMNGARKAYLQGGGGALESLGGHLHVGGKAFVDFSSDEISRFYGCVMDHFVYYPIRDRMPGAVRGWAKSKEITKKTYYNPVSFISKEPAVIFRKLKEKERFRRSERYADYDTPSAFRFPAHGIEYRSLPSFPVEPEFTETIYQMALDVAKLMVDCINKGEDFEFNSPPTTEDYLRIFSRKTFASFIRYINGDKRDIFLRSVFDGWGSKINSIAPFIAAQFNGTVVAEKNLWLNTIMDFNLKVASVLAPHQKQLSSVFKCSPEIMKLSISTMSQINGERSWAILSPRCAVYSSAAVKAYVENIGISRRAKANSAAIFCDRSLMKADDIVALLKQAMVVAYRKAISRDAAKNLVHKLNSILPPGEATFRIRYASLKDGDFETDKRGAAKFEKAALAESEPETELCFDEYESDYIDDDDEFREAAGEVDDNPPDYNWSEFTEEEV